MAASKILLHKFASDKKLTINHSMTINSDKLSILLSAVEAKYGSIPRSPTDFELLGAMIASSVKRTISASTLKRLWGYSKSVSSPTFSTLSLLSRYVGYADWEAFCRFSPDKEIPYQTSAFTDGKIIAATDLPADTTYMLTWHPQKSVVLIKQIGGANRFRVVSATNIKLMEGDIVEIDSFAVGLPLHASVVTRNGESIGHYFSARQQGIATITFLDQVANKPIHIDNRPKNILITIAAPEN